MRKGERKGKLTKTDSGGRLNSTSLTCPQDNVSYVLLTLYLQAVCAWKEVEEKIVLYSEKMKVFLFLFFFPPPSFSVFSLSQPFFSDVQYWCIVNNLVPAEALI